MTLKNKSDYLDIVLVVFLAIVTLFLISSFYNYREVCLDNKVVGKVGSCNSEGRCSVKYTDGSIDEVYLPIEGKSFCKKYARVFWWGNI